jgi:hypothetical protein
MGLEIYLEIEDGVVTASRSLETIFADPGVNIVDGDELAGATLTPANYPMDGSGYFDDSDLEYHGVLPRGGRIIYSANAGEFTAGKVRVAAFYSLMTAPTS